MGDAPSIKRRLAAILAVDIAGYSRLMGQAEVTTVRDLKGHQAVILPLVGRHGGRVIDTAGDGILAEFASVVDATECAVAIQRVMAARNEDVLEDRRMLFRIGINLGNVIHDETRIYGDGINVAARLEALATPGGVLISQAVHDQVRDRLDLAFGDLGERALKNIARPVRVYRLRTPGGSKAPVRGAMLPLPEKPSIAVLPFVNMSGDPEQGYFADGIAEDIITGLSQLRWLFDEGRPRARVRRSRGAPALRGPERRPPAGQVLIRVEVAGVDGYAPIRTLASRVARVAEAVTDPLTTLEATRRVEMSRVSLDARQARDAEQGFVRRRYSTWN